MKLPSSSDEGVLFVVDGIEQNDLWSNVVYLSRQYPITNIKSVEVIYGPASTIYGANAYLGVVSVITKNANDFLGRISFRFMMKVESKSSYFGGPDPITQ